MMIGNRHTTIATAIVLLLACSCSTIYRRPRPDLPVSNREATELLTLHEDFIRALSAGEIEQAEAMLKELELGIKTASNITLEHWSFSRTTEQAGQGRERLRQAKERVEVQTFINLGRDAIKSIERAGLRCLGDDLEESDVEAMADAVKVLRKLQKQPRPSGADEYGYDEFVSKLAGGIDEWHARSQICSWTYQVGDELRDVFSDLSPGETPSSADAWLDQETVFIHCLKTVEEAVKRAGVDHGAKLPLSDIRMTIDEAQEYCANGQAEASFGVARLTWFSEVDEALEDLKDAREDYLEDEQPRQQLDEIDEYKEKLLACSAATDVDKVIVADHIFASDFGQLDAASLNARCIADYAETTAAEPILRWRAAFLKLLSDVKEQESEKPEDLNSALLKACLGTSTALAKQSEPQWKQAKPLRSEIKAAKNLWRRCDALIKKLPPAK